MMRLIRLAVMGAVGYWIYDTISSYVFAKRHPAIVDHSDSLGQWAGPVFSSHGAAVKFRDSDGAERKQMIGRGVVS